MLTLTQFKSYLESKFPTTKFFNGAISKEEVCVGIFTRSGIPSNLALGGKTQTSYGQLPLTLLIHGSENTSVCEALANSIYEELLGTSNVDMSGTQVPSINLPDPTPTDLKRDADNICEMVIRVNLVYNR